MTQTVHRKLLLRTRRELEFRAMTVGGKRRWSVKDPLALKYFQLRDEEHFLLQRLHQPCSLASLQADIEEEFAPARTSPRDLQAILGSLHREGLLVSEAAGQGELLFERARSTTRRDWWSRLSNVLAIRFRGIDAEPILARCYPLVHWVFRPWFLLAALMFIAGVAAFALLHADDVYQRMPSLASLWTVKTLIWLGVSIAVSKVIHELGHGLTCRRVGGECHEIGLMLLVFTPCLYCNVTDIWMQPNKWRRAAVSAAGVGVELLLASVAFVVWWNSQPGLLHSICFTLMIVCSLNSVLFNGNPLLRYDGYFVLADLLEIPNLANQSSELLQRVIVRYGAGVEPSEDVLGDFSRWRTLLAYGIASLAYRLFVLTMIFWFLYMSLAPWGLEAFVVVLALIVVVSLLLRPASKIAKFFQRPGAFREMKWLNLLVGGVLIAFIGWALFTIPTPHRVFAPALLQAADAKPVYVEIPGRRQMSVKNGESIRQGNPICRLVDLDLELEIARLRGEVASQESHLRSLQSRSLLNESFDAQLPSARQRLSDLQNQLRHRRDDWDKLTIRAPADGVVLPPRRRLSPEQELELPDWTGSPLDAENEGCYLNRGQLVCRVGDPAELEALLVVAQSDVRFLREDQRVTIQIDQLAGEFIEGSILEIAERRIDDALPELVHAGELTASQQPNGVSPTTTSYLVRVRLDQWRSDQRRPQLLRRATGQARIHAEPRTVWRHAMHFLARTFGFDLVAAS